MTNIDKQQIEHLAKLARIELTPEMEERLTKDLANILDHFSALQELAPIPMPTLKAQRTSIREDADEMPDHFNSPEKITERFPETQNGMLKIPPVFE